MIDIELDDLSSGEVISLLQEHRREMFKHSPAESVHALDVEAMYASNITFWSAWMNDDFAGCVALKELDAFHGEIKSMKTCVSHVRKGVGAALLSFILAEANRRGYSRISLETGTMDAFIAARKLYEKSGFQTCAPFSNYLEDQYSVCMTKLLN